MRKQFVVCAAVAFGWLAAASPASAAIDIGHRGRRLRQHRLERLAAPARRLLDRAARPGERAARRLGRDHRRAVLERHAGRGPAHGDRLQGALDGVVAKIESMEQRQGGTDPDNGRSPAGPALQPFRTGTKSVLCLSSDGTQRRPGPRPSVARPRPRASSASR